MSASLGTTKTPSSSLRTCLRRLVFPPPTSSTRTPLIRRPSLHQHPTGGTRRSSSIITIHRPPLSSYSNNNNTLQRRKQAQTRICNNLLSSCPPLPPQNHTNTYTTIRQISHNTSSSHSSSLQQQQQQQQHNNSNTSTTIAIRNPRRNADGNEMSISITPRASQRLKEIMTREQDPNLKLRINVTSGGCHGFQYLMSLTSSNGNGNVSPDQEEDTVFQACDGTGAKVVVDESSLELLKGSKVDYTMELIGSQFRIVDNPLATSSCGCGTSFDLKS